MAASTLIHRMVPSQLRSNSGHEDEKNSNGSNSHGKSYREDDSREDQMAHDEDRLFLSSYEKNQQKQKPLTPAQINTDPEKKELGYSSKHLRLDDFELIKTLGTGTHILQFVKGGQS